MPRPRLRMIAVVAASALALAGTIISAQTDLDAFMKQVMERRDDNWKKLQQYILDEREEIDIRGPARIPIWGARYDYTWFIQDGFFVRSPLKANGVAISEDERRKYETNYLQRQQRRERRRQEQQREQQAGATSADPALPSDPIPTDIEGFIRQTRQPEFISSAYFLDFKFDSGRYALVGRETLDGQNVLRIEYYPEKLFRDDDNDRRRRERQGQDPKPKPVDETMNRLMNKGSRVTLWVEPDKHQIVQYTFDNVNLDFLPAQWLATVSGLHASMRMAQAFPEVWLPRDLHMTFNVSLAIGEVTGEYALNYHDYRQAEVKAGIRVPGAR